MAKTPLNNIDQGKIIPLNKIIGSIEETIETKLKNLNSLEEKLDKLNFNIEHVDSPFAEIKELKEQIELSNRDNDYLRRQNERLEKTILGMENKLKNIIENDELKRIKEAYKGLLVFTFNNLSQHTSFDPAQAKSHWESFLK